MWRAWRRSLILFFTRHVLLSVRRSTWFFSLRSLYKTADCGFQLCSRFATLLWKVSWSDLGGPSAKESRREWYRLPVTRALSVLASRNCLLVSRGLP